MEYPIILAEPVKGEFEDMTCPASPLLVNGLTCNFISAPRNDKTSLKRGALFLLTNPFQGDNLHWGPAMFFGSPKPLWRGP